MIYKGRVISYNALSTGLSPFKILKTDRVLGPRVLRWLCCFNQASLEHLCCPLTTRSHQHSGLLFQLCQARMFWGLGCGVLDLRANAFAMQCHMHVSDRHSGCSSSLRSEPSPNCCSSSLVKFLDHSVHPPHQERPDCIGVPG